ncbi:hypothetical protein PtB15_11B686 [Puccinia triticina]|nr:hypothetical protein PtB15_11B686 [Puccinia triticina]
MNMPIPQLSGQNAGPSHSPGSLLFAALQGLAFEPAKKLALEIRIGSYPADPNGPPDNNNNHAGLVHILIRNLVMAQRMQGQSNNAGNTIQQSLAWAQIMIG